MVRIERGRRFSALQRAEIAEMLIEHQALERARECFSALQRAEIAEIARRAVTERHATEFQCSSTSRNC